MNKREFNWAILGTGVVANEMANALKKAGKSIYAVGNRTHSKAVDFAEKYGVKKVYDDFHEMFSDKNVDIIYITTPHNTHIDFMMEAISNGKHILCEKSITLNSDELNKAIELAEKNNVVLAEAMTIYHMPLYKKLKEIGFRIYILSNNHQKRTKLYTTTFLVDGYLVLARKPFVYKIRPFLKKENIEITNTILIGDQLLTDIKCANKLGLDSVLVKSISRKSEKWYTRINRLREKRVINNIAKVDKEKAIAIAKIIGERNDSNE